MKKQLTFFIALICGMATDAQVMKIFKGDVLIKEYKATDADKVVFCEESSSEEGTTNERITSISPSPRNINFKNVQYYDWNNGSGKDIRSNYLADLCPNTAPTINLSNGSATAVYYLSPSNANENSIRGGINGLSFIFDNYSGSTSTTEGLSLKPVSEASKLESGRLTLCIKKNDYSLKDSRGSSILAALRLPLSDDVLSLDERGKDVCLFSDWSELTEETVTPHIHNNIDTWGFVEGDHAIEGRFSHFYSFSDIYTMYNKEWAGIKYDGNRTLHYTNYNRQYVNELSKIAVAYNKPLDLKPLVTVCDNCGNIVDWQAYGLSFEFNKLESFNVIDQNTASTYTNQQNYISIENGVVTPQSTSGQKNSLESIDKTPVIQVILRDKTRNAVVDVRYIILNITEKEIVPTEIYSKSTAESWSDGRDISFTLTSEDFNIIAEKLNLEGLNSGVTLQYLYTFDTKLYAENGKTVIGDVQTKAHGGEVMQAQNIVATFNKSVFAPDDETTNKGYKTVTGYVHLKNLDGQYVYYIKIQVTVNYN